MKRFSLLLAVLSAALVSWRCLRGRHPQTGRRLMFCPECGAPTEPERWARFVGKSDLERRSHLARQVH